TEPWGLTGIGSKTPTTSRTSCRSPGRSLAAACVRQQRSEDRLVLAQAERGPACPSRPGNGFGGVAGTTVPALPGEARPRGLGVVAHPDDMEYGTSAAVARWTARGVEVGYLLLTRGEAGMPNPPEETARLRVAEQQAACAAVGVTHLTILEHPDGVLVYGLDLRRDIC